MNHSLCVMSTQRMVQFYFLILISLNFLLTFCLEMLRFSFSRISESLLIFLLHPALARPFTFRTFSVSNLFFSFKARTLRDFFTIFIIFIFTKALYSQDFLRFRSRVPFSERLPSFHLDSTKFLAQSFQLLQGEQGPLYITERYETSYEVSDLQHRNNVENETPLKFKASSQNLLILQSWTESVPFIHGTLENKRKRNTYDELIFSQTTTF
jgi:hypothetical protein